MKIGDMVQDDQAKTGKVVHIGITAILVEFATNGTEKYDYVRLWMERSKLKVVDD